MSIITWCPSASPPPPPPDPAGVAAGRPRARVRGRGGQLARSCLGLLAHWSRRSLYGPRKPPANLETAADGPEISGVCISCPAPDSRARAQSQLGYTMQKSAVFLALLVGAVSPEPCAAGPRATHAPPPRARSARGRFSRLPFSARLSRSRPQRAAGRARAAHRAAPATVAAAAAPVMAAALPATSAPAPAAAAARACRRRDRDARARARRRRPVLPVGGRRRSSLCSRPSSGDRLGDGPANPTTVSDPALAAAPPGTPGRGSRAGFRGS